MADAIQSPEFTPTPEQAGYIASAESGVDTAKGNLALNESMLQRDRADFNPMGDEGTGGPRPTFNEPDPQDHMQDIMKVAPLWMALGAMGGAFFKQSGFTMLSSTNAMMKGLVQGNADAYAQAREKYDKDYAEFRDKQKTWQDVYRAYLSAYKGRIDADVRVVDPGPDAASFEVDVCLSGAGGALHCANDSPLATTHS